MDLSALIFVALAVAWATYLIPKALRQHEDSSAARNVEGFSARLRVLARRESTDGRSTRLVVSPGQPAGTAARVDDAAPVRRPVSPAARRAAAAAAARRRLRVVLTILLSGVVVAGLALGGVVTWGWLLAPTAVLAAWLVACRLMVKREWAAHDSALDSGRDSGRRLPFVTDEPQPLDETDPATEEIVAVEIEVRPVVRTASAPSETTGEPVSEPVDEAVDEAGSTGHAPSAGWDPVPPTLPTYVDKAPAARRSVRTIDLDATGVWTSGPLASDSALAREADAERSTERASGRTQGRRSDAERRASGS